MSGGTTGGERPDGERPDGGTAGGGRPEVAVTPRTCVGTGVCAFYAPATFELDERGRVRIATGPGEDSAEDIGNAAEACPTQSITLSSTGER
ncbi:ferredoxin [Spirillospora sp. NPDC000708]